MFPLFERPLYRPKISLISFILVPSNSAYSKTPENRYFFISVGENRKGRRLKDQKSPSLYLLIWGEVIRSKILTRERSLTSNSRLSINKTFLNRLLEKVVVLVSFLEFSHHSLLLFFLHLHPPFSRRNIKIYVHGRLWNPFVPSKTRTNREWFNLFAKTPSTSSVFLSPRTRSQLPFERC